MEQSCDCWRRGLYCRKSRSCKRAIFSPNSIEADSGDGSVKNGLKENVHGVLGPDGACAELEIAL